MSSTTSPTRKTYAELERAYAFFNAELFDNRLPHCMITLQRQHDTYGYFSANQFVSRGNGEHAHEIALNPSYFAIRPIPETLSVLVREMVSLDQVLNTKGKLPRRRYRNREWADMVEAIGLMPTDTGLPGGKRVGDSVQTYIIEGGCFDVACSRLVDEAFVLSWVDRFPPRLDASNTLTAPEDNDLGSDHEELSPQASADVAPPALESLASLEDAANLLPDDAEGEEGGDLSLGFLGELATAAVGGELLGSSGESVAPVAASVATKAPPMKRFEPVALDTLAEIGIEPKEPSKNASKTKFSCPACGANAWGKPLLRIHCSGPADSEHALALMALN